MKKGRFSAPREWVVEIPETKMGMEGEWAVMPEDLYCPSSGRLGAIEMHPRTFHGVVRQMKNLILPQSDGGWGFGLLPQYQDCRLRNINTGEVIPWAIFG